jgi:uncharacterized protein with HEPN domain
MPESDRTSGHLWELQRAAERIADFTAGHSFDDYLADVMLRSAVERQLEIIGEALFDLRRIAPDIATAIPDPSRIIEFRNVLVHGYAAISDQAVWDVIQHELPRLRDAAADLLQRAPSL